MQKCKCSDKCEIVYIDNDISKGINYVIYKYKGFLIYKNYEGSIYGSKYYTVVNIRQFDAEGNNFHVHCNSKEIATDIINCFIQLKFNGYAPKFSKYVKNKACRLMGIYIKS